MVEAILTLYEGAETTVGTSDDITDWFKILEGLHQGTVLSPLQFITVMEFTSREISERLLMPPADLFPQILTTLQR